MIPTRNLLTLPDTMARTTTSLVQGILLGGQDYDTANLPSLEPYIDSASSLIDAVVACAIARHRPLTAAQAEIIERWVSAHLYAMSDQTYAEKWTGKAKMVAHGKTGMHLEATKYGQVAMDLDTSGCLVAITTRSRASLTWLGKPPSEQIPYADRD